MWRKVGFLEVPIHRKCGRRVDVCRPCRAVLAFIIETQGWLPIRRAQGRLFCIVSARRSHHRNHSSDLRHMQSHGLTCAAIVAAFHLWARLIPSFYFFESPPVR